MNPNGHWQLFFFFFFFFFFFLCSFFTDVDTYLSLHKDAREARVGRVTAREG
jgi:hypothetical protein